MMCQICLFRFTWAIMYWMSLLFLSSMMSVKAWCYVTMLEVGQAHGQTLFRGQCCWKNFSLWRKQTAHWLCSLLSGCINRPLTSLSVTLFPLSEAHWGRCRGPNSKNWSSVCRRYAQTNSVTRIYVNTKTLSLPLSFAHKKNTLLDLVSRGLWKCV